MLLRAHIKVIDARKDHWGKHIQKLIVNGRNFVIIMPHSQRVMRQFCKILGCYPEVPDKLGRWAIHALNDVLAPAEYKRLLLLHHEDHPLFFVEPLKLHLTKPLELHGYIVYCELRGIVAHYPSRAHAISTLRRYVKYFNRAGMFPLAGIYNWSEGGWSRLRNIYAKGKSPPP